MAIVRDTQRCGVEAVDIDSFAAGGEGVGRLGDQKTVFCAATVPGDQVSLRIVKDKKRWARAELDEVLRPGPDRVEPRCSAVAAGCGGCDWQHVHSARQPYYKALIAREALRRLGGAPSPEVATDRALEWWGYRTTIRVIGGPAGAGFRGRQSSDVVVPDECHTAHPALAALLSEITLPGGVEAILRLSVAVGNVVIYVPSGLDGVAAPPEVTLCDRGTADQTWIYETVGGVDLRVSAASFFQARPDGAERLAALVGEAVASAPPGPVADLYAGVGLFSAISVDGRPATAVELAPSSVADARVNLAGRRATVIEADVEAWEPTPAAVTIADPPRRGLGAAGVAVVAGTGAERVVLVSCDVGAMGRDVGLLRDVGYAWRSSTVVDMFPQTSHLEVVTVLDYERA